MTNRLQNGVVNDLARIYLHNAKLKSHDRAIEIEDGLYDFADRIRTGTGADFRGRTGLKSDDGYIVFFVEAEDHVVVYAVYHERENWDALVREPDA
ncbi:type II toxin-antitoxin system RelE/ParE family toxin [Mesorhizobium sp. 2RAF21]|uniref:type II toxin-antitoxin system RelE/ParE family toxin n=1 Tax=Mesorhizobium sp. 2RAF21 TaxID=3232995 RepID=UPI003F9B365E